jgi:hypothetical protein
VKNLFISYTGSDRDWAEWITWQLEGAGYTATLQAWDFRPGSNFVLNMDKSVRQSERVIAVLSKKYISSAYTRPEWAIAFSTILKAASTCWYPCALRIVSQMAYWPRWFTLTS